MTSSRAGGSGAHESPVKPRRSRPPKPPPCADSRLGVSACKCLLHKTARRDSREVAKCSARWDEGRSRRGRGCPRSGRRRSRRGRGSLRGRRSRRRPGRLPDGGGNRGGSCQRLRAIARGFDAPGSAGSREGAPAGVCLPAPRARAWVGPAPGGWGGARTVARGLGLAHVNADVAAKHFLQKRAAQRPSAPVARLELGGAALADRRRRGGGSCSEQEGGGGARLPVPRKAPVEALLVVHLDEHGLDVAGVAVPHQADVLDLREGCVPSAPGPAQLGVWVGTNCDPKNRAGGWNPHQRPGCAQNELRYVPDLAVAEEARNVVGSNFVWDVPHEKQVRGLARLLGSSAGRLLELALRCRPGRRRLGSCRRRRRRCAQNESAVRV